jgi:glycosyltransferase involved in cell wall biosynthesis
MRIIIYNINSFGGNHEYAKALGHAYHQHELVSEMVLLMPKNSNAQGSYIDHLLLPDIAPSSNKILRRLYFVYRSFINPLRLVRYLRKHPGAFVIFNDYDQLTSFFWSPLLRPLKKKHAFAVILHDPDRDKYFSSRGFSVYTMKKVMQAMQFGFYHGYLPDKPYYKGNFEKVIVPHGIFEPASPDLGFVQKLQELKKGACLLGVLGNIRDEKNYDIILQALEEMPGYKLLVAGAPSNSGVDTEKFRQMIRELKIEDRVTWLEKFLTEEEMNAAIQSCDIILLYYKSTFTSQSGILNKIAPYRKKLIVAETPSALQQVVQEYGIGELAHPGNPKSFIDAVNRLSSTPQHRYNSAWENYESFASWHRHTEIAIDHFKKYSLA